jgi:hypothetical protein
LRSKRKKNYFVERFKYFFHDNFSFFEAVNFRDEICYHVATFLLDGCVTPDHYRDSHIYINLIYIIGLVEPRNDRYLSQKILSDPPVIDLQ